MPELTFCIPVAPYHTDVVHRAITSVQAQTIPCEYLVFEDKEQRGAGFARNEMLRRVTSTMISFLDADDTISPHFAEMCLALWQPGKYVYTDWFTGGQVHAAPDPCKVWTRKTYHLVNSVIPVEDVRRIGGFDEALPAAEDTDFGLRLRLAGLCGIRVKEPLVNYSAGGLRSLKYVNNRALDNEIQSYLSGRYGGYKLMGCCGEPDSTPLVPGNQQEPGDVLVQPTWVGNRAIYGAATNRFYGTRVGGNKPLWVALADLNAMPDLFKRYEPVQPVQTVVLQPAFATWKQAGEAAFGGGQVQPVSRDFEYQPVVNNRETAAKLKIAQRKTE